MTCLWSHELVVVLFSFISGSCFWCRGFPVVQNGHPQGSTSFECKKRAGCHGCRWSRWCRGRDCSIISSRCLYYMVQINIIWSSYSVFFIYFKVVRSLVPDPLKQEAFLVENVPDRLGDEQVTLLHHFFINHLSYLLS